MLTNIFRFFPILRFFLLNQPEKGYPPKLAHEGEAGVPRSVAPSKFLTSGFSTCGGGKLVLGCQLRYQLRNQPAWYLQQGIVSTQGEAGVGLDRFGLLCVSLNWFGVFFGLGVPRS